MIKVENTKENRTRYRELLFTTENLEEYISGVIMFQNTVDKSTSDGQKFVDLLTKKGILIGIKLDKGMRLINGTEGEMHTQGLTDLDVRAKEFYEKGCRFAKWRAALKIGNNMPSQLAIDLMASSLARYAQICQANGIVPIVEPEVLIDGNHSVEACQQASFRANSALFKALHDHHVFLEGCVLKPNMITPGLHHPSRENFPSQEIAARTVITFLRTVPAAVPGIFFLSGGQSEEEATINLNEINKQPKRPWHLSFSYGRALQFSVLMAWKGLDENKKLAQDTLLARAKANSDAVKGIYVSTNTDTNAKQSLVVENYIY